MMLPIMDGETMALCQRYGRRSFRNRCQDRRKTGKIDVPADLSDLLEEKREQLLEHVAESSEELMEKYFSGEEFTPEELRLGLIGRFVTGMLFRYSAARRLVAGRSATL